jgi:tRNA (mo5U34)-methyltransferase
MGADLASKVAAIPFWYHKIQLPGGLVTPGYLPHDPTQYHVPKSLIGKRVLDVGAWDGYWTFEALRRGALEVVAIDDFSDNLGNAELKRPAWETFDLCAEALDYGEDCVTRREMSVYDVSPETVGMFDVVFFFGTLYHLRHPLLALDKLASVCTGEIFIESAILDDYSPYRGGIGHGYPGQQLVMEFYPDNVLGGNSTNWWSPTLMCLGQMVRAAGFTDVKVWKLATAPNEVALCRGFASAKRA